MDVYVRFDFPGLTADDGGPFRTPTDAQQAWFFEFLDACGCHSDGLPSSVSYRIVLRKGFTLTLRFTLRDVHEPLVARHRVEGFLRDHTAQGLPGSFTFLEPVSALLLVEGEPDRERLSWLQDDLNDADFAALIPTPTAETTRVTRG